MLKRVVLVVALAVSALVLAVGVAMFLLFYRPTPYSCTSAGWAKTAELSQYVAAQLSGLAVKSIDDWEDCQDFSLVIDVELQQAPTAQQLNSRFTDCSPELSAGARQLSTCSWPQGKFTLNWVDEPGTTLEFEVVK